MSDHPQIAAFNRAAGLLHDERYWARNKAEDLEFLRSFMPLLR